VEAAPRFTQVDKKHAERLSRKSPAAAIRLP
jgi:hypothetical protein